MYKLTRSRIKPLVAAVVVRVLGQTAVMQQMVDALGNDAVNDREQRYADRHADKAEQAAEELKLTADDALALGVVESVIPEAGLGEPEFYDALAQRLMREVDALTEMPIQELLSARYARFRRFGGEAQR